MLISQDLSTDKMTLNIFATLNVKAQLMNIYYSAHFHKTEQRYINEQKGSVAHKR